jgi:pimeloyl-ACP methyl ester carboxylesterase
MNIKFHSQFKDPAKDQDYFKTWVKSLETHNGRSYEDITIATSLGKTQVWGLNTQQPGLETLVVFPGARTTALIWDFDRGLDNLQIPLNIYLVETNGLPNLSDGATPDIKSLDFGHWAAEVFEQLGIQQAYVAGASFGGLICMKMSIVAPEKIKAAFLLNPGCLQPFSLSFKNLYYNLLPLISPTQKNVSAFLDQAIFCKPTHQVSDFARQMLLDYEVFAISRYQDKTQKPYYMNQQLAEVKVATYLLEGDKDLLFPFQKSIANARLHLQDLKDVKVFENVAHGIETYAPAMNYIGTTIKNLQ